MSEKIPFLVVDEAHCGRRLDAALQLLIPELGLRGRRRLIANGRVLVDKKWGKAAQKLRTGQILKLLPPAFQLPQVDPAAKYLGRRGDYLFFYKPAGIHSVGLAGSAEPSLEWQCQALLASDNIESGNVELLQRLDFQTSGLICATAHAGAKRQFRMAENNCQCRKYYLALLEGKLEGEITVKNALDCANRKKTAILDRQAHPANFTFFKPLRYLEGGEFGALRINLATLALCVIRKGQRHQIRAHAASMGHPLLGDSLYGNPGASQFQLLHFRIELPGHDFHYLPPEGIHALLPREEQSTLHGRVSSE